MNRYSDCRHFLRSAPPKFATRKEQRLLQALIERQNRKLSTLEGILISLRQLPRERSEGRIQILVVDDDVCRELEPYRCKIPDRLDSSPHHLIGNLLCKLCRSGDDAKVDAHPPSKIGKLLERQHRFAMDRVPDLVRISIERSDYAEAEGREPPCPSSALPRLPAPTRKASLTLFQPRNFSIA
jgi:hypothetical protein